MKKDKEKIRWRVLTGALSIGLSFFSAVHAQTVPTASGAIGVLGSPQAKLAASKISRDLMNRYQDWVRERKNSGEGESAGRTSDASVIIDAIASKDAQTLKRDMEALGLKNSGMFGRVVSGNFPLAEIPKLSGLKSLNFARRALAQTHN